MSKSLQMSLTNSKIRSVSLSPCRSRSFRDLFLIWPERTDSAGFPLIKSGLKNVGVPSIVLISGFELSPETITHLCNLLIMPLKSHFYRCYYTAKKYIETGTSRFRQRSPPLSNSCADIFLTGVPEPELHLLEPVAAGTPPGAPRCPGAVRLDWVVGGGG